MKHHNAMQNKLAIQTIPEYSKRKLDGYANSFCELAELIAGDEQKGYNSNYQKIDDEEGKRQLYFYKNHLYWTKEFIAKQLVEMAGIMQTIAKETMQTVPLGERRMKMVKKALKEVNIDFDDIYRLEHDDGHTEIILSAQYNGKETIYVEDVADLLSVALNMRLNMCVDNPAYMNRSFRWYRFYEEPCFQVLTGVASAVRESEKISGDNFLFIESMPGHFMALLSDGTGSGEIASENSDAILMLFERLLRAGFGKEKAIELINNILNSSMEDQNIPTLDVCDINLYQGSIEIQKVGASCSFLKRDNLTERIFKKALPLGVSNEIHIETISRDLVNGDYIIMMTDGILDAVSQGMGEEVFSEFLSSITSVNPSEIANQILQYCIKQSTGQIRDDMTVLVVGVWQSDAEDSTNGKRIYREESDDLFRG